MCRLCSGDHFSGYKSGLTLTPAALFVLFTVFIQTLFSVCGATIIHLPLKYAVGVEKRPTGGEELKRAMRSIDPVTQRVVGISGEGYYLDVNVGTPPQKVSLSPKTPTPIVLDDNGFGDGIRREIQALNNK